MHAYGIWGIYKMVERQQASFMGCLVGARKEEGSGGVGGEGDESGDESMW